MMKQLKQNSALNAKKLRLMNASQEIKQPREGLDLLASYATIIIIQTDYLKCLLKTRDVVNARRLKNQKTSKKIKEINQVFPVLANSAQTQE